MTARRPSGVYSSATILALALSFSVSLFNCPQAARISRAARRAHRARIAGRKDDVGKRLDPLPIGTFVRRAGPGIEGNQIDLGRNAFQKPHQFARLGRPVIDILQHHIFEGDPPGIGDAGIGPAGLQQLLQRIFLVERHEPVAQIVAHRMQRDREHGRGLGAEPSNLRHDARGRDGDPPFRQSEPVAVGKHADRIAHIFEIIERLAHAHEDDVRDGARVVARQQPVFGGVRPGKSPSLSRATTSCATISRVVRLRTSFCVPVWQKLQVKVQPTWLEMQSVPRSLSGI